MVPCKHEEKIEEWKKEIPKLMSNNTESKTRLKMWGTISSIIVTLCLFGLTAYTNMTARAQDTANAAIAKVEKESRDKDKEQDKEIKDVQITVKGIEGKIENALKEADRKQQETLEAIKELKEK